MGTPAGLGMIIAYAKAFDGRSARGALRLPHRLGVERGAARAVHRRAGDLPVLELPLVARALPRRSRSRSRSAARRASRSTAGPTRRSTRATRGATSPPTRTSTSRCAARARRARPRSSTPSSGVIGGDRSPTSRCSHDVPGHLPTATATGSSAPPTATASPTSTSIPSPFLTGLFDAYAEVPEPDRHHRDQPGLPVRLHVLRLGLGHH